MTTLVNLSPILIFFFKFFNFFFFLTSTLNHYNFFFLFRLKTFQNDTKTIKKIFKVKAVKNLVFLRRTAQSFGRLITTKNKFFFKYRFTSYFLFINFLLKKKYTRDAFTLRASRPFFAFGKEIPVSPLASASLPVLDDNWFYLTSFLISPYLYTTTKDLDDIYEINDVTVKKFYNKRKRFIKLFLDSFFKKKKTNKKKKFNANFFLRRKKKFLFFYKKLFFKNFFFLKNISLDSFFFLLHFYYIRLKKKSLKPHFRGKPYSFFFNKKLYKLTFFKLQQVIVAFKQQRRFYRFFKQTRLSSKKTNFKKYLPAVNYTNCRISRLKRNYRKLKMRKSFFSFFAKSSLGLNLRITTTDSTHLFNQIPSFFLNYIRSKKIITFQRYSQLTDAFARLNKFSEIAYSGKTGFFLKRFVKFFFLSLALGAQKNPRSTFFLKKKSKTQKKKQQMLRAFSFNTRFLLLSKFHSKRLRSRKFKNIKVLLSQLPFFKRRLRKLVLRLTKKTNQLRVIPFALNTDIFASGTLVNFRIKNNFFFYKKNMLFRPLARRLGRSGRRNFFFRRFSFKKFSRKPRKMPLSAFVAKINLYRSKLSRLRNLFFFFLLLGTASQFTTKTSFFATKQKKKIIKFADGLRKLKVFNLTSTFSTPNVNFLTFKDDKFFFFLTWVFNLKKKINLLSKNLINHAGRIYPFLTDDAIEHNSLLNSKFIIFYTKTKTNFLLGANSFLLQTQFFFLTKFIAEHSYLFKKKRYSFSHKNEMQNYLIKRYFKNKIVQDVNYDFFWKKNFFDYTTSFIYHKNTDAVSPALINWTLETVTPGFSNAGLQGHVPSVRNWTNLDTHAFFPKSFFFSFGELALKRVKFKPGYSIIWRKARTLLQTELGVKLRYQHKLTRFLFKYYKFSKVNFFFYSEMRLDNILLKSKLLPEISLINLFIEHSLIYLNGNPCSNLNLSIVKNDFVQLVVHNKYYIFYRWAAHLFFQKRLFLKHKIHTKLLKNKNIPEDKQRSPGFPKWVLNNKITLFDTPNYLEVDYFTLSFFLIYEPFNWIDIDPYYFINLRSTILNMYNWKYIN